VLAEKLGIAHPVTRAEGQAALPCNPGWDQGAHEQQDATA